VNLSINSRMLIAAGIILFSFLGVTGVTLENSFHASTEEALKERLRVHLNALIASAEVTEGTVRLAYALPESRFFTQGSGLYAKIIGNNDQVIWSSPSMEGITIPVAGGLARGITRYQYLDASNGESLLVFSLGVNWGEQEKPGEGYTFVVAEGLGRFNQQILEFRQNLWGWLGGVTIILLFMLTVILRWGLTPLREVADDLADIEAGRQLELHGSYPKELRNLTDNLNALMRTNREHEERYQASLGDLAHSLKTPLSVLRGAVELPNQSVTGLQATVEEQVGHMDQIVQYQLQRAAVSGRTTLLAPIDMLATTQKIIKAMNKVYADKALNQRIEIEPGLAFHCEEGDMMELLGNLIDNACKWARREVEIRVGRGNSPEGEGTGLLIEILDDGQGIDEENLPTVLSRGGRADEQVGGHGLGLAIVRDIVELYNGRLVVSRASLGGAQVTVWLPMA
jgi:two-component system sensor histidine kinase PhoQ